MTREQKIEWLANASGEQLVEQLRWSVTAITSGNLEQQIEGNDDYALVKAEILRRLADVECDK